MEHRCTATLRCKEQEDIQINQRRIVEEQDRQIATGLVVPRTDIGNLSPPNWNVHMLDVWERKTVGHPVSYQSHNS